MNISFKNNPGFAQFLSGNMMKSTQEKMQRRQNMENQVAFLQQQKENLKNKECGTLEEIADKLEAFHSYEDEIAAVKKSYNQAEAFHALDEARERGEQIAKAAEKSKPKTAEERKKEAIEEALGTDENKGMLTEMLEEMDELAESQTEELEEMAEELDKQSRQLDEESLEELILEEEKLAEQTAEVKIPQYVKIDLFA